MPKKSKARESKARKRSKRTRARSPSRPTPRIHALKGLARALETLGDEPMRLVSLAPLREGCEELEKAGLISWHRDHFDIRDERELIQRFEARTLSSQSTLAAMALMAHVAERELEAEEPVGVPVVVRLSDGRLVQPTEADSVGIEKLMGLTPAEIAESREALEAEGLMAALHSPGEPEMWGMIVDPEDLHDWGIDPASIPEQRAGESIRELLRRA